jgi:hypothetical protein
VSDALSEMGCYSTDWRASLGLSYLSHNVELDLLSIDAIGKEKILMV